ncbi:hypothetical protein HYALB_00003937 [Hymenoscyphus albidus]|uniref:Uncharacterized protein n=1 Tax=Hymenoscyphus albidus TaxID=595503 RepID=A0A9N9LW61_9HELO|nr:hypothetical protein HYALB_00003937 [Hymenoscyphus albidus]
MAKGILIIRVRTSLHYVIHMVRTGVPFAYCCSKWATVPCQKCYQGRCTTLAQSPQDNIPADLLRFSLQNLVYYFLPGPKFKE